MRIARHQEVLSYLAAFGNGDMMITTLPNLPPYAGFWVVRIDPLHFLTGCCTRRL